MIDIVRLAPYLTFSINFPNSKLNIQLLRQGGDQGRGRLYGRNQLDDSVLLLSRPILTRSKWYCSTANAKKEAEVTVS